METLESVLVHITGSDVPLTPPKAIPARRRTSLYSITSTSVTVDGGAVVLLADAPSRKHASVIVSGTAGDTMLLASSAGAAQEGHGAVIPVGTNLVIDSTDLVWLGNGTIANGNTVTVSVIAEYEE